MSNQRAGKSHKAALGDGSQDMKLKLFFQDCASILDQNGYADSAFWFEQIVEHIMAGKPLPSDKREIARVLGC